MQLKDKLILITGASGGIGEELAEQLADEKCRQCGLSPKERRNPL